MNQYFTYDSMHLWNWHAWDEKLSPMNHLIRHMTQKGWANHQSPETPKALPDDAYMNQVAAAWIDPALIREIESLGLHFEINHAGENWFTLMPDEVKKGEEHDPVTLFILDVCETKDNPRYAMELLEQYRDYWKMAAREHVALEFVASAPSRVDLSILILRELSQRYNLDYGRFYMDVSALIKAGGSLKDVPMYQYKGADGQLMEDPDMAIERITSLHRWALTPVSARMFWRGAGFRLRRLLRFCWAPSKTT